MLWYLGAVLARQEEAESGPDSLQRKRWARKDIRQENWFVLIPSLGLILQATKHIRLLKKSWKKSVCSAPGWDLWGQKWWLQDNTTSAVCHSGVREGHLIPLFPSYPLLLPSQAARAIAMCVQRTPAFPWAPERCQDTWNFWRSSLPEEVSREMVKWQGSRLCWMPEHISLFLCPFSAGFWKKQSQLSRGNQSTRGCQGKWVSRQPGEVLTSPTSLGLCQEHGRSLTNCTLDKTAQTQGPRALCSDGQQNGTHKVRVPHTKERAPKPLRCYIKGFSSWTPSWEGRYHLGKGEIIHQGVKFIIDWIFSKTRLTRECLGYY